jgi:hypothetical protein
MGHGVSNWSKRRLALSCLPYDMCLPSFNLSVGMWPRCLKLWFFNLFMIVFLVGCKQFVSMFISVVVNVMQGYGLPFKIIVFCTRYIYILFAIARWAAHSAARETGGRFKLGNYGPS